MITKGWPELKPGESDQEWFARFKSLRDAEVAATAPGRRPVEPSAEEVLEAQLREAGVKDPVRELLFADFELGRRWRFDFAWPEVWIHYGLPARLAVEIDGEAHRTRERFRGDMEKMNVAAALGWTVLHFRPCQVRSRMALDAIRAVLEHRPDELLLTLQRRN